jgi:phosphate transport system substrate-binding protein
MFHRYLALVRRLVPLALGVLLVPAAGAQEIKIGGTGASLATMQRLAQAYRQGHPEANITVLPSLGSGGGIKAVLAGAIQVAVSSRALTPAETSQGASSYEYARTPFVFAVATHTRVDAITSKDLVDIYSGARDRWPDGSKIRLVLRPEGDSDRAMVQSISPEVRQAESQAEKRPGMKFSVTDQDAADDIETIPGAFGVSTLAQIITEKRAIKPLRFNGVEPSPKTLANGSYPLYKQLFIVTSPKTPAPALQFVAFVRSAAGRGILARTGHVLP